MADPFPPAGVELPNPDWDFSNTPQANVEVHKFGDGYETRESVGLNSVSESFTPKWSNLSPEVGEACYDDLLPKLKKTGVIWTHPVRGTPIKVIPEAISLTYDTFDNVVLDISFRQDFNPG